MRIEKDQIWTLAVIAGLVLLFVFGQFMPHRKRMAGVEAKIQRSLHELKVDGKSTTQLVMLAAQVDELEASLKGAQRHIPPQGELANLLKQLSGNLTETDEAGRGRVTDQEMQTRAVVDHANYSIIPVGMRFRTTFASTFNFLRQIEAMERVVRVDDLVIDARPAQAADRHDTPVDVKMDLSAFFAPTDDR